MRSRTALSQQFFMRVMIMALATFDLGCKPRVTGAKQLSAGDQESVTADRELDRISSDAKSLAASLEEGGEEGFFDPQKYMAENRSSIEVIHVQYEQTKRELLKTFKERGWISESVSFFERLRGQKDPFFQQAETNLNYLLKLRNQLRNKIGRTDHYDAEIAAFHRAFGQLIDTSYDKTYDGLVNIGSMVANNLEQAMEKTLILVLKSMPDTTVENCRATKVYGDLIKSNAFQVTPQLVQGISQSELLREALNQAVGIEDDFSMLSPKMPEGMCNSDGSVNKNYRQDSSLALGGIEDLEYLIFTHLPFLKFAGAQFAIRGFVPAGSAQVDIAMGLRYGTPFDGSHLPCTETFASVRAGLGNQALRGLVNSVTNVRHAINPLGFASKFLKRKLVVAMGFKSLELPPPLINAPRDKDGRLPNILEYPIISLSLMASGGTAKVTKTFANALRSWFSGNGFNPTKTVNRDTTWDFELNVHPSTQTLYVKVLGGGSKEVSKPGVATELLEATVPGFGVTAGAEVLIHSTCSKRRHALAAKSKS